MSLTSDEARNLAEKFFEVANRIQDYRFEAALTTDEQNTLMALEIEIRGQADKFTV